MAISELRITTKTGRFMDITNDYRRMHNEPMTRFIQLNKVQKYKHVMSDDEWLEALLEWEIKTRRN